MRTSTSQCIAEFGRGLCEVLGKPYLAGADRRRQHHEIPAQAGELTGLDPEPFIAKGKHSTIKPVWDLWRSVTQDFFATASSASSRTRPMPAAIRNFPRERHGPCLAPSRLPASRVARPTTTRCARDPCKRPLILMGSINEKMYLAEMSGGHGRNRPSSPQVSPAPPSGAPRARPSWATRARPT